MAFYESVIPSTGLSILLLSFTFSILLIPLQRYGQRVEQRIGNKIKVVNDEVRPLKGNLKGEDLFLETEKIYKKYGYHPIQSIALGLSFFVMIPVLISAILIFTGDSLLTGKSFLFIKDLSMPDGLINPVNILLYR